MFTELTLLATSSSEPGAFRSWSSPCRSGVLGSRSLPSPCRSGVLGSRSLPSLCRSGVLGGRSLPSPRRPGVLDGRASPCRSGVLGGRSLPSPRCPEASPSSPAGGRTRPEELVGRALRTLLRTGGRHGRGRPGRLAHCS